MLPFKCRTSYCPTRHRNTWSESTVIELLRSGRGNETCRAWTDSENPTNGIQTDTQMTIQRIPARKLASARRQRFRIVDTKNRFSFWQDEFKSFEPVVDKIDTANWFLIFAPLRKPIQISYGFPTRDAISAQIGAREYRSVLQRQQGRKIREFYAVGAAILVCTNSLPPMQFAIFNLHAHLVAETLTIRAGANVKLSSLFERRFELPKRFRATLRRCCHLN